MRAPTRQPSFTISGRLRSMARVTVNSSFMIGAGPFSRARSRAASQPATAISRDTFWVKATDFFEPYFMQSRVMVEPNPKKPVPAAGFASIPTTWRRKGEAVDLDDVVEHPGEHLHDLAVGLP